MSYRTALVKSTNDNFIELEVVTGKTVKPGMLVERVSGGKCQPHSTAGGNAQKLIAIENYLEGEDIDTAYAAGDKVIVKVAAPGERFAVLHDEDVSSSAMYGLIQESDWLESDGDGQFRPISGQYQNVDSSGTTGDIYTNRLIAVALESNDTTDSSSVENPRFAAEIV